MFTLQRSSNTRAHKKLHFYANPRSAIEKQSKAIVYCVYNAERNSIAVVIVTKVELKNKRYLPYELTTKVNSVKMYRRTKDIDFALRRYRIFKEPLMRRNKLYDGTDGTRESLMPKAHRTHSRHSDARTEEEPEWIRNYHRRNPNISICEKICSFR